jgi:hypothetical protein
MAQGVILRGRNEQRRPKRSLTILVPRGHESEGVVIVGVCHVCGSKFGEGQEQVWQKHVGECARAHMDEIQASTPSERAKGGPWDPNNWDPEVEEYLQRVVGPRMLREGRFEMKPSEYAGLS